MSNPYYQPDPSGLPTGLPGFTLRRSSYASAAASGSPGSYGRSGATFQQLLNNTNADGTDSNGVNNHSGIGGGSSLRPPYGNHSSSSSANHGGGNDADDTDPMWTGLNTSDSALLRLLGSRNPQLPSFSRAFEPFLQRTFYDGAGPVTNSNTGFFTPSYLRESVYVQRLEEQYKAKMQAIRESQQLHARQPATAQPGTAASGGGGMMIGAGALGGLPGRPSSTILSSGSSGLDGLSTYASLTSISINNGAGALGNGKIGGPGSHRGLAYDVVEKGAGGGGGGSGSGIGSGIGGGTGNGLLDDEEPISPLPSRWDKDDKAPSLDVLSDGLDVKFAGSRSSSDHSQHAQEAGSVRADHYMPPQCGIYYYEVTILSKKREESTIGIGFSEATAKLSRPPGWEPGSWGYHSDDGNVFTDHGSGKKYGPSFGPGDIVGCGVNFRTGTAFFTKNGEDLGIAFRDIKGPNLKLCPSVGMKKMGEHVRVNFGQLPFTFDIDGVMKRPPHCIQHIDRMAGAPKACRIPHRYVYICFITLYSLFLIPTLPYVIVFCILYFAVATLVTRLFRMDHNAPGRNSNQDAILEQGYEVQPPRSTRRENDNLAQTLGLWTALHSRTHFYDTHAISVPYDLADEYHPELEFLAHPSSPYHPASTLDISPSSGATNNTDGSLLDGTFALNRAPYSPASIEKEKQDIKQQILKTTTDDLAPAASETDLVQQLVLQFLQHDGYVDTARAFAKEIETEKGALNIDSKHPVRGYNIADDEDANKRQRIRRAVLEGDIDRALALTKADYPNVLDRYEAVHFRLKCRKFIEMIRKEAELNIVGNGSSNANGNGNVADSGRSSGDGARQTNGHGPQMDVDDVMMVEDSGGAEGQPASQALVQDALKYGQDLQIEFQSDLRPRIRNALNEVFSLLAYTNPLKQPAVAHLLDQRGRVAVAEELNSAILQSLGKSSRSALENLYAQTNVLLEDLRQNGGPGSFVTIQGELDEIPQPYTP